MITIDKRQIEEMESKKKSFFAKECEELIKNNHPEIYASKNVPEWNSFIIQKLKEANSFGISKAVNQYLYCLTIAKYPKYITQPISLWVQEILKWPGRSEEDKIIILNKEIYKKDHTTNSPN